MRGVERRFEGAKGSGRANGKEGIERVSHCLDPSGIPLLALELSPGGRGGLFVDVIVDGADGGAVINELAGDLARDLSGDGALKLEAGGGEGSEGGEREDEGGEAHCDRCFGRKCTFGAVAMDVCGWYLLVMTLGMEIESELWSKE